jgi:hypothetical protein
LKKEGDKQSSICNQCEALTSSTFKYRDVSLSDNSITAHNLLVAVCDVCNSISTIPHQESSKIKAIFDAKKNH